uniref:Protein root UVB sensitive/RUS domain-containing protein n=1 Tax=Bubo bubo TaxID=30461 RepID=A0A8C0FYZ3_BUBBB
MSPPAVSPCDLEVPMCSWDYWNLGNNGELGGQRIWVGAKGVSQGVLLPQGYPESISPNYLRYQCWEALQVQLRATGRGLGGTGMNWGHGRGLETLEGGWGLLGGARGALGETER